VDLAWRAQSVLKFQRFNRLTKGGARHACLACEAWDPVGCGAGARGVGELRRSLRINRDTASGALPLSTGASTDVALPKTTARNDVDGDVLHS
jgi:hypothetical protein